MIRSLLAAMAVALTVAMTAALTGCATPQPTADETPWTSGRLALRVDATPERTAQSVSAAFELRGASERGELRLSSPLGTLMASATWSPGQAMLLTTEGERRFASLDDLARQALGEPLPLAALPDWLAGRPWPEAPHEVQADGFGQLGWRVQTRRLAEGWITAQRLDPPGVQLRVKLDRPDL